MIPAAHSAPGADPGAIPAPPHCEACERHLAAIAELSAALTLLYTRSTLTEPLPASLHDQVKRAFAAGVTPCFEKPYAERVKMRDTFMAENKPAPEAPKERKPLRIFHRNWLIEHIDGASRESRTEFKYTSPDGSTCGLCSSIKACKKTIDELLEKMTNATS